MTTFPGFSSISTRLVLVFFLGVTLAVLLTAGIHLYDRDDTVFALGSDQTVERFVAMVQILNRLPPEERKEIAKALDTPLQFIRFLLSPPDPEQPKQKDPRVTYVRDMLQHRLGGSNPIHVHVFNTFDSGLEPWNSPQNHHMVMENKTHDTGLGIPDHPHPLGEMFFSHGISFIASISLADGTWIEFHNHLHRKFFSWPIHLALSLVILIAVVTLLSFWAVRLVTQPMRLLAKSADQLGRNLQAPPLKESGPQEVRQTTQAFNIMQARLLRFIGERTQLLAAISHDLKTPLTRMKLRAEMLKDPELSQIFLNNLNEMEEMIGSVMDYAKGMEGLEKRQPTDVCSILDTLQMEFDELGKTVIFSYTTLGSAILMPKSFKRCLTNLILNAVTYGQQAHVMATRHQELLRISISDQGPGIPPEKMESVLEPFVRLENSRNRQTGGSGLGLAISHNIIRAHGGKMTLRNRPEGGLEVILTIPNETLILEQH